jgi:hypothetical protein
MQSPASSFVPARRRALRALAHTAAVLAVAPATLAVGDAFAQQKLPEVEVWKSPTCGCCNDWIKHLEANGFKVKAVNVPDSRHVRAKFGMPAKLGSCHTALVGGYVVEGHVPAREIKRLLKDKPGALGITVPGMPIGSPGMDGPIYKGVQDPYDVLLVQADGSARVFASYPGK